MRPVRDVIVRVNSAYKTKFTTSSGVDIFLDPNLCQVKDTVRFGEVVFIPDELDEDIEVGDVLFFHHGIVGISRMDGQPDIESPYMVDREEKLYRVPMSKDWPMAYAVSRDGVFKCLDGICFVRPVYRKKVDTFLFIPGNEEEVPQVGELVYVDDAMSDSGLAPGDKVVFEKDSEYQFEVGGETLYCMFSRWIFASYEDR